MLELEACGRCLCTCGVLLVFGPAIVGLRQAACPLSPPSALPLIAPWGYLGLGLHLPFARTPEVAPDAGVGITNPVALLPLIQQLLDTTHANDTLDTGLLMPNSESTTSLRLCKLHGMPIDCG